jgi:hypothetical protein
MALMTWNGVGLGVGVAVGVGPGVGVRVGVGSRVAMGVAVADGSGVGEDTAVEPHAPAAAASNRPATARLGTASSERRMAAGF